MAGTYTRTSRATLRALVVAGTSYAAYGDTQRVSLASDERRGTAPSFELDISGDGRYVAFVTASQLNPRDKNGTADIFVRDRRSGTTEHVSQPVQEGVGNSPSDRPSISVDGWHVAFRSFASNLVPNDTNDVADVFTSERR